MTRRRQTFSKWKLRKGDQVIVIAGKSKGVTGKIDSIDRQRSGVVVAGVNMVRKHTKPTQNSPGGIVDKPMPLHVSNVAMLDPRQGGPTRVGFRLEEGRKVRYAKKSGAIL